MDQYLIASQNRHLRYVFFIDIAYDYSRLLKLMTTLQRHWGGRYNPIIPIVENEIPVAYHDVIKHFDPDFVFHTKSFDPEKIKRLRIFNPIGYYVLDIEPRERDICGIDALYFLRQFDHKVKILVPEGLYKTNSPLLDYYETNFGLTRNAIISDYEISKGYDQVIIKPEELGKLNKIIHHDKPINQALLSRRNIKTTILRDLKNAKYNSFEIVLARDVSNNNDLFYFWNRLLYQAHNIIYLTVEQLLLLTEDSFFGGVLYDLSMDYNIDVVSLSLTEKEVNDLIASNLNKVAFNRQFQYKDISGFPYKPIDANGLNRWNYEEPVSNQILLHNQNLFFLSKLSFTNKIGFYPQEWAVDIDVKESNGTNQKKINFPSTTDIRLIVRDVEGRVNRSKNISFVLQNQKHSSDSVQIKIPSFAKLLNQLITSPFIVGNVLKTKYLEVAPHDASNRLKSFIRIFKNNLDSINEYFTDKFWVDIFEQLCTSNKPAGDAISFDEIFEMCATAMASEGVTLGIKGVTNKNPENLSLGLKQILTHLCRLGVLIPGFKLKCDNCSSIFWYNLKDTSHLVSCKGCLENFNLPIEASFNYKLNDLIKNNIFQSKTQRDGNLTVIRTLAYLNRHKATESFQYNPQINIFDSYTGGKPVFDIDIVALVDGKFVIGEAKHNSSEFSTNSYKSLTSLIELSKEIYPDIVILSCYVNDHSRLENAKKFLEHHFKHWHYAPEVQTTLLSVPTYYNLTGNNYFYY